MLPCLDRLSLGDATAGFYELTAAEQQRVTNEGLADPITFDNPTHVMTFRVQMDVPNPDGTPRYAYYSPASLWGWVRQSSSNGKLPHNPSQKILNEDWYRLRINYDPRGTVPGWVNQLEHEHVFLARMAQAEQRARDRLAREAEERERREEEKRREREAEERRANELPALLQLDAPEAELDREHFAIVRWRFWMAGHWSNQENVHKKLKEWFGTFIFWLQTENTAPGDLSDLDDINGNTVPYGASWPGLAVRLRSGVRSADGRRDFTEMLFAARMPRAFAVWFVEWATSIIDRFGYDDFLRRAHRHYGFFGGAKYGCTFDHPHVVELGTPVEDPEWCEMPAMTDEEYRALEEVHGIREPEGWARVMRAFDNQVADDREPFPPEPEVRLQWRFWLKDGAKKPTVNQMRKRFVAHVMKAPPVGMGATSRDPWKNLEVTRDTYAFLSTEEGDDPNARGRLRTARPTHWIWTYKFALKLKKSDIDAFVAHFRDRSAFYGKASYLYRRIFEIDSSVKTADGDWQYPRIVGDPVPPGTASLHMTQQEYDAWNTQAELHWELFGSDSEGEE